MPPLLLPLFDPAGLAPRMTDMLRANSLLFELRRFPDGETYFRADTDVNDRDIILLAALDHPDEKIAPLLFAADSLKDLGARSLTLAAPYLPYMRQDKQFRPGEAITSRTFAHLVSQRFDKLVTIDPHLHRYRLLSDIYTCETRKLTAGPLLAQWISENVKPPFVLMGPDSESRQWVEEVASPINADFIILEKTRHGDRNVEISTVKAPSVPDLTPILVDDTISTATTMCTAVHQIIDAGYSPPICCAVHGIFSGTAYEDLITAGATRIITTNSVAHECNEIDIGVLLANALGKNGKEKQLV